MDFKKSSVADTNLLWAYRLVWLVALLAGYFSAYAQPDLGRSLPPLPSGYWLELEETMVHNGGELDGMTTYRLYVNCLHPLDYVSSCSGDDSNPLLLESTSDPAWYNSSFATGWNASGIHPAFFSIYPEIVFDSYLTLGAEDATTPGSEQPLCIWGEIDATMEFDPDGPGQSLAVNDPQGGAWYAPFPGIEAADTHPAFAGDDLRVLIAQLTTSGNISGQVQIQIFRNGLQSDEFRSVLPIATAPVVGCMNPDAFNFNPEATSSDGSMCNLHCTNGTRFDVLTGTCELEAWLGEVGNTAELDPCHLDFDNSGWMDITDLFRFWVVSGQDPGQPLPPCGAGTYWDTATGHCLPAPKTLGEGNGLGNLNPRYFDLNGDGMLDTEDFLNVLNVFGKACN